MLWAASQNLRTSCYLIFFRPIKNPSFANSLVLMWNLPKSKSLSSCSWECWSWQHNQWGGTPLLTWIFCSPLTEKKWCSFILRGRQCWSQKLLGECEVKVTLGSQGIDLQCRKRVSMFFPYNRAYWLNRLLRGDIPLVREHSTNTAPKGCKPQMPALMGSTQCVPLTRFTGCWLCIRI